MVRSSQEGITQGDHLAMPMYAMTTLPLIRRLPNTVTQIWYADDASATGLVTDLRKWWGDLASVGPCFGYNPNPSKSWLVTKEDSYSNAVAAFEGSNINMSTNGHPYLGAALGTDAYINQFVTEKVDTWSSELRTLSEIAATQPHAAFAAFTHGLQSRWSYLSRTQPNVSKHYQHLENIIRSKFIPALTGNPPPNDSDRDLFALPAKVGGQGLCNPTKSSDQEYTASRTITKSLVDSINNHHGEYSYECITSQMEAKAEIRRLRHQQTSQEAENLKCILPTVRHRAMELASEKGASNWLTALPIEEYGFRLHKGAFRDTLSLRYGWPPSHTPAFCVCGMSFTVEHSLSCPRGGFPIARHNEIRDITANLLTEVCHDVMIEPELQPLTGEILNGATSNSANGAKP